MQPPDLLLPDQSPDPLLILGDEQVPLVSQVPALSVKRVPWLVDCCALAYSLSQSAFPGEELEEDRLLWHLLGLLARIRLLRDPAGDLLVLLPLPLEKLCFSSGPTLVLELRVSCWIVLLVRL